MLVDLDKTHPPRGLHAVSGVMHRTQFLRNLNLFSRARRRMWWPTPAQAWQAMRWPILAACACQWSCINSAGRGQAAFTSFYACHALRVTPWGNTGTDLAETITRPRCACRARAIYARTRDERP